IKFFQTSMGKTIAVLFFSIPFITSLLPWWENFEFVLIVIGIITFIPQYRRLWLLLSVLILVLRGALYLGWKDWHNIMQHYDYHLNFRELLPGFFIEPLQLITIGLVLSFSTIIIFITNRFQKNAWLQKHVVNLFTLILSLILLVEYGSYSSTVK